jgi:hypothetical protein
MVSKRIKVAIIVIVLLVVGFFGSVGILSIIGNMEHVSDVQVENPGGNAGVAFVVYQPGISNFQEQVTNAFVNGLISNDWRVEITTASSQTPTDLSSYDLLVLGSPIYADTPLRPIMDYVSNVDDLEGMDTVILLTGGAGTGAEAPNILGNHVQEANGIVVKTLMLYSTQASNEAQYGAQYGTGDPLKIATKAGQEIPLP